MEKLTMIFYVVFYLFSLGCQSKTEITTATQRNITESVYASGTVKGKDQYEVYPIVNAKIETIFIKEGDLISKGMTLFQLESNSAELSTGNAFLAMGANTFKQNKDKLNDAQNAIELAQKICTNDSILLQRQQNLWIQNIGSKRELEQKELNYESSKVNVNKAKFNYQEINKQLKLAAEQSTNNLKMAQIYEKGFLIRSEIDGIVYQVKAKKGQIANTMSSLAILGQKSFLIEFNVDELDIVKIKKDQKVLVRMDSYKNQIFEAKVSFIYPLMDERTRSFKVEADFIKLPEVLYPNLSLEGNIIINEKKNVLTIPTNYVVDDSKVLLEDGSLREIKIGLSDYTLTEVISGIDENTKIKMPR